MSYSHKVLGITSSTISKIDGVTSAATKKVIGVLTAQGYSETMTVGETTFGWGYSQTDGSITNPNIPLFGTGAYIYELDHTFGFLTMNIAGLDETEEPSWTSIDIAGTSYNRTQFTISYGNPLWYYSLTTSNPFGTTIGATKLIQIS